ncbi:MAG TPA: hypothetical protein VGH98_14550 [Gemmatimonadaceae bacterium]|jgi:hypothetical protein
MSSWLLAALAGLLFAILQYAGRDFRLGLRAIAPALLRFGAVAILAALLLDAPAGPRKPLTTWVALDASASWRRGGDALPWQQAWRDVRVAKPESLFLFGDSLRAIRTTDSLTTPGDLSSIVRPAVERALGRGHPLVVVTDGELADPQALSDLPAGSRVVVVNHPQAPDLAVASLELPRAIVSGDTVEVHVGLVAGAKGSAPGKLTLTVGDAAVLSVPVDSLGPYAERPILVRARVEGREGPTVVRAIVKSPGDAEPRNDTLSMAVDLSRAASAVFVSTSPDLDARYALSVLRGALAVPTRGYFRVAPNAWRVDGSLAPVSEADVRTAFREAPVAILHGDTAAFGPPRAATRGPLALVVPATTSDGEWYVAAVPPSPLAPALSGLLWDSLPPIAVGSVSPAGQWRALEVRLGREDDRRVIIAGTDTPRRVVVVAASGLYAWRSRGGPSADAFTALWGSLFDWLAAERADRRAAVPTGLVLRAGEPVRWHRGSASDSSVLVVLRRLGATTRVRADSTRVDSMTLRFRADANVTESPALAPGIYTATVRGGTTMLAVNNSREWLPSPPRVRAGAISGGVPVDSAPRLRTAGWAYALLVLFLCAEWVVRRRIGMR